MQAVSHEMVGRSQPNGGSEERPSNGNCGRQDDAVREKWSSGSPKPQDKHEEPQHTNPDPEFPTAQHPVSGQQVLSAQPEHYTGQW